MSALGRADKMEILQIYFSNMKDESWRTPILTAFNRGHGDILATIISPASSTLESLDILPQTERSMSYLDYIHPITNLSHFTEPTSLATCQDMLLGKQYEQSATAPITLTLPPNLETLHIWYPTFPAITHWLSQLLEASHDEYLYWLIRINLTCANCRGDSYERFIYTRHMFPIWNELENIGCEVKFYHLSGEYNPDWKDENYDPLTLDIYQHLTQG
jgi:hypothetical protein